MTTKSIQVQLPKGIRIRGNALAVQTKRNVRKADGTVKEAGMYGTVVINYPKNCNPEARAVIFDEAIAEAKKLRKLHIEQLTSRGGADPTLRKRVSVHGTLETTMEKLFIKRWGDCTTGNDRNVRHYINDIYSYFPKDIRLVDMQTDDMYEGFVKHCKEVVIAREANNYHTVNTRTVNKRLGILRLLFRYAIRLNLLEQSKLLNPDIRVGNMGWENLPEQECKRRFPLSKEQELEIIDVAMGRDDTTFVDMFIWLLETGMRVDTEFLKFTVQDVNFKENFVYFFRPKTNKWSKVPLSDKCIEIANRLRILAMERGDRKMFGHIHQRQVRTYFEKYKKLCKLEDFTKYIPRHTFLCRLGKSGEQPKVIMRLGGHKCIETAQKFYIEADDEDLDNAIEKINNFKDKPKKVISDAVGIGHNSRKALK
jgi:integrase